MNSTEIDQAIESLPDDEYECLADAAASGLYFRAQSYSILLLVFGAYAGIVFAAHKLIRAYWQDSLIAATITTLMIVTSLLVLLKIALSLRVTDWLLRRSIRRAYRARCQAGAP